MHRTRQLLAMTRLKLRVSRLIIRMTLCWLCNKVSPLAEVKTVSLQTNSSRMPSLERSPLSRMIRIELHAMVKVSRTCFRWRDRTNPAFITIEHILLNITTQYWLVNMMMLINHSVEVPLRKTLQPSLAIIVLRSEPLPILLPM